MEKTITSPQEYREEFIKIKNKYTKEAWSSNYNVSKNPAIPYITLNDNAENELSSGITGENGPSGITNPYVDNVTGIDPNAILVSTGVWTQIPKESNYIIYSPDIVDHSLGIVVDEPKIKVKDTKTKEPAKKGYKSSPVSVKNPYMDFTNQLTEVKLKKNPYLNSSPSPSQRLQEALNKIKPFNYEETLKEAKSRNSLTRKKPKEKEEIIIDKDEELIINIEELADELAGETLKFKENTLKYEELLNFYKTLILKHERRKKE